MKNAQQYLVLFSLALICQCVKAQSPYPGILYSDFNPDIKLIENYQDTLGLDFNHDGASDVLVYFKHFGSIASRYGAFNTSNSDWGITSCEGIEGLSVPLPNIPSSGWGSFEGLMTPDSPNNRYGIRYNDGAAYYYGWFKMSCHYNHDSGLNEINIDKIAFCTVPDYPLLWGQTSLNTDVDESESTDFATIHPNPTTGLVTITGKDLKQAEVLNMLGQRVANATGEGERITIDISSLPTGIYFVNVTDKEGRKCVRKVVKE